MATEKLLHIVVITTPERLGQDWMARLASESVVKRLDRVGVLQPAMELVQQTRPDIVIVDRDVDQAELIIRPVFTTLPGTLCIAIVDAPDLSAVRRLVSAGARDVLARPVSYSDLLGAVRELVAVEADRRTRVTVSSNGTGNYTRGKLVLVYAPKGGAGATTIATNMAIALRQLSSGRVCLADFSLQFGHVGVQLNLWSKHTIEDLLARSQDIDDTMLAPVLQQHTSGIAALLAPTAPDAAADITREQIDAIIDSLLARFTYVVVDTWSFLDEVTMTLLRRADEVLLVVTPEIPALRNAKRFLDFARQHSLAPGRTTLVLNRFPSVEGISVQDVQEHLRTPVGATIPSEGKLVVQSINRGEPLVLAHPQSWVGQSLARLAAYIAGEDAMSFALQPARQQRRLFGDRRLALPFRRREA